VEKLSIGRCNKRDGLTLVAPIDPKISAINRYDAMSRVEFAHTDEAKIGEIRRSVHVCSRELCQRLQMICRIKCEADQPLINHFQNQSDVLEMKSRFGKDSFARQQRRRDARCHFQCPIVMSVCLIRKCNQKAGVGDSLHEREKPLRFERSFGPRTVPASFIKDCFAEAAFAFSS
jgi:hypothetical protein